MFASSHIARWFLAGGTVLAFVGFALWFVLPISMSFPPYLPTALLALACGVTCLKRSQPGDKKP